MARCADAGLLCHNVISDISEGLEEGLQAGEAVSRVPVPCLLPFALRRAEAWGELPIAKEMDLTFCTHCLGSRGQ